MGHPTLPGLVPLVALALMMGLYLSVAAGMSIQKRHQEKRDIECPQGKYRHPRNESICCLKCHKGTYLEADCGGPDLAPNCKTCEKGTYTAIENYLSRCHSCSTCRRELGQVEKESCTFSRNTVCGCGDNQYQQRQGTEHNGVFKCVNCNPCLNGTIQRPCREKEDAVCSCNKDFFWDGQRCISCNECVPEKKCGHLCPSQSVQEKSDSVLMPMVIFLGFCCLSLICIVFFCNYPRWRSKLYVIVCGRQSPPVKEEENGRPLFTPPNLDSTPVPSQIFPNSPLPVSTPAPPFSSASSSSNWPIVYNVQPIVTLAPPHQRTGPITNCAQMPSDCVMSDVTALLLDKPAKLYAVVDEVPPSRWKEFMRRLGLGEHHIEFLEMQNPRCLREAHYSMLAAWQKGVPGHQATLEVVAQVLTDMDLDGCLQNIKETLKLGSTFGHLSPLPR